MDQKSDSLLTLNFRFVDSEYLLAMLSRFITPWQFFDRICQDKKMLVQEPVKSRQVSLCKIS